MSITVVDVDERFTRRRRTEVDPNVTYPHIKVVCDGRMYRCNFAGTQVVSTSVTKVEEIVMGIIDRMRELGLYVDSYKPVG